MQRLSTGVPGLDQVLHGGLISQAAYLVRGGPGRGKTTLGLHFLYAGSADENSLFIGFQESDQQLRDNARAIGLDVSNITFLNLSPDEEFFTRQEHYDVFSAAEVEQAPLSESIVEAVNRLQPKRVFVDSLTQLRFLTADVFQYRKEVLSFLHYLKTRHATVMFSSEHSDSTPDDDLQFLADGVISLTEDSLGSVLCVEKFRGSSFMSGCHQMRNGGSGIEVFARPVPPKEELTPSRFKAIPTGIERLDSLLCGGLESGTITMITGPSGIGKSTLASCIAAETARCEGHACLYLFEEEVSSFLHRANNLGIDLEAQEKADNIIIEQVEPMRYLADEFASRVYRDVMVKQTRLVVFDSTAGFQLTLADESIKSRLHALAKSLSRINVSVLLINETASLNGNQSLSEKGISYLSDNIISLTYDYSDDTPVSLLTVAKKRLSGFDRRPYRYQVGPKAITLQDV